MRKMRNTLSLGLLSFALLFSSALSGCGGGGGNNGPKTARVSGTVTLQGKPLDGASVYFQSENFSAVGKTNAQGRYELIQGAIPGVNKIYISKLPLPDGVNLDPEGGADLGQFQAAEAVGENDRSGKGATSQRTKELVPEEFSNPKKSKLTFPVPAEGTTSADFRL